MKKYFEYIGLITLVCFSFFITEQTVTVVKDSDGTFKVTGLMFDD